MYQANTNSMRKKLPCHSTATHPILNLFTKKDLLVLKNKIKDIFQLAYSIIFLPLILQN